jgi:hypothetical protein
MRLLYYKGLFPEILHSREIKKGSMELSRGIITFAGISFLTHAQYAQECMNHLCIELLYFCERPGFHDQRGQHELPAKESGVLHHSFLYVLLR